MDFLGGSSSVMTLKRRSTVVGHTDLTRFAVVEISDSVKGHNGWATREDVGALEEEVVKSCGAVAIVACVRACVEVEKKRINEKITSLDKGGQFREGGKLCRE